MTIIQCLILCVFVGVLAVLILICGAVIKGIMKITDEREEVERDEWKEL